MSKRYVQPGQKPVEPNTEPGKDEQSNNAVWEEDSRKVRKGGGSKGNVELRQNLVESQTKPGKELKIQIEN